MTRREFVVLLGSAAVGWPFAARAQPQTMPVIGFFRSTRAAPSAVLQAAFVRGLSEAGFVEGQNVAIEYRWGDDRHEHLPAIANELVQRKVAVIIGNQPAAAATKSVTATVPIVFVSGADPLQAGLVASINRPGGNVTGVIFTVGEVTAKRLGLLRELIPNASVIGVLVDPKSPAVGMVMQGVEEARRALGVRLEIVRPSSEQELEAAFGTLARVGAHGLLVGGGGFFIGQRQRIAALAARHRLPASYVTRLFSEAGGLMSYGPSQTDAYRQAGGYVARILRGTKPGDLPVEQSSKFELVINLRAAKELGLAVPNSMQLLADEVIE
jgi:putative tryptophan/tyrosine transport system substrate-binding protein